MSEPNQYIIGSRNAANKQQDLQRVLDAIKERDDATVKSGDTSKHLIVDMPDAAADDLQTQLGQDVIIEKDSPLQY